MNLNTYQDQAMTYRMASASPQYALLNLAGEVGELMSLEAKCIRDGAQWGPFLDNAKKELGDILWCLAAVAMDYGFSLEDVAKGNLEKLESRKARGTLSGSGDER
jgi:NTP pyrophosphatase (non-canonical NTP hydrolase)